MKTEIIMKLLMLKWDKTLLNSTNCIKYKFKYILI